MKLTLIGLTVIILAVMFFGDQLLFILYGLMSFLVCLGPEGCIRC